MLPHEQLSWSALAWARLCRIVGLALPLTISQFFTFALGLIALLFVGRLGEQELAIAVLATSFMNVTGGRCLVGLSCAGSVSKHNQASRCRAGGWLQD